MKTSVLVICPFCDGHTSLVHEGVQARDTDIIEHFRGRRIDCSHPGCGESFAIRREDLKIRRQLDD